MKKRWKQGLLWVFVVLCGLTFCGCRQESSSLNETEYMPEGTQPEYSETASEGQWISSGNMDEYEDILIEYAKAMALEVTVPKDSGNCDIGKGILCDLNGDGMTPELLWVMEKSGGYTLEIAYLANDGALSTMRASLPGENGAVPQRLLYSRNDDSGIWDILVTEKREDEDYTSFYRYENGMCRCAASLSGLPENWNGDGAQDYLYQFQGMYRIRQQELWEGAVLSQDYVFDEATGALVQKIPDYVEALEDAEEYWLLTGAAYIPLEEGKTVYQIDFTKEIILRGDEILPIGLLTCQGQDYILVESNQGEMGYILDE